MNKILSFINFTLRNLSILSISSSGDNTLYLLSKNPKEIIAIDNNPYQNYLLELKSVSIKELKYNKFLEFIGLIKSNKRHLIYNQFSFNLTKEAKDYWDKNINTIKKGIIHCGKLERYLMIFRKYILPISQSNNKINRFLSCKSIKEQKEFYRNQWDTFLWKATFYVFFSKIFLKKGREKSFFKYNKINSLSFHYLKKTKIGFTEIPINNNYFLYYILKGNYNLRNIPDYLKEENFIKIKNNINKLKIKTINIKEYLLESKDNKHSKFNLSDIFEIMSEDEYEKTLKEIIRVSEDKGIICYWNNLVRRNSPLYLKDILQKNQEKSRKLFNEDRVFFYNDFIIESINKV